MQRRGGGGRKKAIKKRTEALFVDVSTVGTYAMTPNRESNHRWSISNYV